MLGAARFLVPGLLLCSVLAPVFAAPTPLPPPTQVVVQLPRANLDDVLYFYSELSGRALHVDAGVGGTVDMVSSRHIPMAEALSWVRRELLEKYGIEIHDTPGAEIRVSWSTDHAEVREATKRSLKTNPPARVIDIATLHARQQH